MIKITLEFKSQQEAIEALTKMSTDPVPVATPAIVAVPSITPPVAPVTSIAPPIQQIAPPAVAPIAAVEPVATAIQVTAEMLQAEMQAKTAAMNNDAGACRNIINQLGVGGIGEMTQEQRDWAFAQVQALVVT